MLVCRSTVLFYAPCNWGTAMASQEQRFLLCPCRNIATIYNIIIIECYLWQGRGIFNIMKPFLLVHLSFAMASLLSTNTWKNPPLSRLDPGTPLFGALIVRFGQLLLNATLPAAISSACIVWFAVILCGSEYFQPMSRIKSVAMTTLITVEILSYSSTLWIMLALLIWLLWWAPKFVPSLKRKR